MIAVAAATAVTLFSLGPATAAAAPSGRGCDRPAGSPEEAAVLQYCPRKAPQERERENRAVAPVTGGSGGDGTAAPAGGDRPDADTSTLPLLGYPASDGINAIVWILLAIAALVAAREVYRRYLAGRIGSGRAPRLPTGGGDGA